MSRAKKLGLEEVDILLEESTKTSVKTRLAKLEKTVRADSVAVRARFSIGRRSVLMVTDNPNDLLDDVFLEKAVAAVRVAPESAFRIHPELRELCKHFVEIDLRDPVEIPLEKLVADTQKCEDIAISTEGITNSDGAETVHAISRITLLKNENFVGEYEKTYTQTVVVPLVERDGELERDYDFSEAVYYSDLKTPEQIAKNAAERTLSRLGARKIPSCRVPVVFEKRVASQLLSSLLDAVNGGTVAKGISFLKDKLLKKVFNRGLNVTDRHAVARGLRSRPFDADGLECQDNFIVKNGVLNSFLLNIKYADQLKMNSTGSASGFNGIAPNNVCIENGKKSFGELIKNIKTGILVTEVLGNGLNVVTGNYSQGAVGFWIENGEILYPVHEITVAGNFLDMFGNCAVASDLTIETGVDSPTLFMEEMVVGGL
jgi:PmbA protein